jgi:hypothetical protein
MAHVRYLAKKFFALLTRQNESAMMVKASVFLCPLLFANTLFAQDKHLIDSLYGVFHVEKDLVKRIDLLYDIANEQDDAGNPDDGFRYADSLEAMSKAARYDKGLARAFDMRGWAYRHKGEFAASLPLFHQQLSIFSKTNDLEGQGHRNAASRPPHPPRTG